MKKIIDVHGFSRIDCSCGSSVSAYAAAASFVKGNYRYYTCGECGQEYMEKCKEPIILEE